MIGFITKQEVEALLPLHYAVFIGDICEVQRLCKLDYKMEQERTKLKASWIPWIRKKAEKIIKNLNNRDYEGDTPLHFAMVPRTLEAAKYQREITQFLLKAGADVNAKNNEGYTPLHYAVVYADHMIVELLMEAGATPNIRNSYDQVPFDLDEHKLIVRYFDKKRIIREFTKENAAKE